MANGDIASGVGWTTFPNTQSASQGYDNDNYALDRAAEQFKTLRDQVLPAVNQPVFACQRSSNWSTVIKYQTWTPVPGIGWATPVLNTGFTSWSAGQLKIAKAGVYRVQAHVQFPTSKAYNYMAAQIVKNTTSADVNVIAKNHPLTTASVDVEGLVRLVAGDVITLLVRQDNTDKWDLQIETSVADLTFSAEWIRA